MSRTLAYAVLVGLLAALYAGSVIILQVLLDSVTQDSDLAVAGSTIVVAAGFHPLRRRIQVALDRRFDRRRYDALRAAEDFGARLRHQVELRTVAADLSRTVMATVAPSSVAVWVPAAPSEPRGGRIRGR